MGSTVPALLVLRGPGARAACAASGRRWVPSTEAGLLFLRSSLARELVHPEGRRLAVAADEVPDALRPLLAHLLSCRLTESRLAEGGTTDDRPAPLDPGWALLERLSGASPDPGAIVRLLADVEAAGDVVGGVGSAALAARAQALATRAGLAPRTLSSLVIRRVHDLRRTGRHREAVAVGDALLSALPAGAAELDEARVAVARAALGAGDPERAAHLLRRARASCADAEDADGEARALAFLANAHLLTGQLDAAEHALDEGRRIALGAETRALVVANLVEVRVRRGDRAGAEALIAEAEGLTRAPFLRADLARRAVMLAQDHGDGVAALARLPAARAATAACGDEWSIAAVLVQVGEAARARGDLRAAEEAYLDASWVAPDLFESRLNLVLVRIALGREAEARALADELRAEAQGRPVLADLLASAELVLAADPVAWERGWRAARRLWGRGLRFEDVADLALRAADRSPVGTRRPRALELAALHGSARGRSRLAELGPGPVPLGAVDLLEPLGRGAQGEVWRGVDRDTGAEVAVKVVTAAGRTPRTEAAFLHEIRVLAGLRHPSIVAALDTGRSGPAAEALTGGAVPEGSPYVVMPLALGGTVEPLCGRIGWEGARAVLLAALAGLAHAHAAGLVHRDVKPANLLLARPDDPSTAQLADFGLSHLPRDARAGTLVTMAPEQAAGRPAGPAADLYAVGCVAWWLVTGAPPFDGDPRVVLAAKLSAALPPLRPAFPVPEGLEAWLAPLLRRRPEERFPSAAAAAAALRALGPPVASSATGIPASRATWGSDLSLELDPQELPAAVDAPGGGAPWPSVPERPPEPSVVAGPRSLALARFRRWALHGREREQEELWRRVREALEAPRSAVIAVCGPLGAGRSALATWLGRSLVELGCARVLEARGDAADNGLAEALGELVGARPPDEGADRAEWLRQHLALAAGGGPLVVVVDDALEVPAIHGLARSLVDHPLRLPIVLALVGEEEELPARAGAVRIGPLAPAVLRAAMVREVGLEPDLARRVADLAEGLPAVAREIVSEAAERGWLGATERGFALDPLVQLTFPGQVHARAERRLRSLVADDPHAIGLLRAVAAAGGRLPRAPGARWARRHGIDARAALGSLEGAGLLFVGDQAWVLSGALPRGALLASLSDEERKALLLGLSRALDPSVAEEDELRGRVLLAAGRPEAALPALLRATAAAEERDDVRRLAGLAPLLHEATLAAPQGPPAREILLRALARVRFAAGDARLAPLADEAEAAGFARCASEIAALLARSLLARGDEPGARQAVARALAHAPTAAAQVAAVMVAIRYGPATAAPAALELAFEAARTPRERVEALRAAARLAASVGKHARASKMLREAIGRYRDCGLHGALASAQVDAGTLAFEIGKLDEARELLAEALATALAVGSQDVVPGRAQLAAVELARGEATVALREVARALPEAEARQRRGLVALLAVVRAGAEAALGSGAVDDLDRACDELRAVRRASVQLGRILEGAGEAARRGGDLATAAELWRRAMDSYAIGAGPDAARVAGRLAVVGG